MENCIRLLEEQSRELDEMIVQIEHLLKQHRDLNDLKIRVSSHDGINQYYIIDTDNNRNYARKSEMGKVKIIAQREYYQSVCKVLMNLRSVLRYFIKKYDVRLIMDVYNKLCNGRKQLVDPIIPTDEEYIKMWKESHPGNKNIYFEGGVYSTDAGDKVRSKSEKIIADLLYKHGIPYVYEPSLYMDDYREVFPDFVLLNVRRRKTFYWEHMGLISDLDYATKNMEKIYDYEKAGYEIGNNLIITMESNTRPFSVEMVEHKIKKYLL